MSRDKRDFKKYIKAVMHQGWVRMLRFGVIMEGEISAEEERCSRHKHQEGACSVNGKERNPCAKNREGGWYKVSTHSMPGAKLDIWHSQSP